MGTALKIPAKTISLAMAMIACAHVASGEARIHPRPILSIPASLEDTTPAVDETLPFGVKLLPELEAPEMPESVPTVHEAAIPAHLVIVGQSHGAMLDRCRPRMRSLNLIGHGASPDGRPAACRLLSFTGRQKFREAAARQHEDVRIRFVEHRSWEPKAQYVAAVAGLPPLPTAFAPPPAPHQARPIVLGK